MTSISGKNTMASNETNQYLANIADGWQTMLRRFNVIGALNQTEPADRNGIDSVMEPPASLQDLQRRLHQMSTVWNEVFSAFNPMTSSTASSADAKTDKRFVHEAWRDDPRFDYLRQSYLAYSEFMVRSVESAQVDDKMKRQMTFAIRQAIDAISPANFFATNPEAIQLALKTNGQSMADGIGLFLQDMVKGRISMTDENAFEVGKNLATTPGEVIFENELIQLIQYAPLTNEVGERPLVIVPPCINKYYILDLQPENSFVRHALEQGSTVYMISWRNVTPELGHLTWDDYLECGVMKAIDVALDVTGADKVNALGFCVGGTLLACAAAVMRQEGDDKIASLTLLTTMLDFCDTGELGILLDERTVVQRERAIGDGGILPGAELAMTFSSLRANDLIWSYVVNSYLKGSTPPAFDLLYWNSDATNLAGPMVTWYLRNTYLENRLRIPGRTIQCGVPVDLSKVTVPAYLYASREDHIVPWQTAYAGRKVLGGNDYTFVLGASGHIAGVINPASKNKRSYWVNDDLAGNADDWLATAQNRPGSWWAHWSAWLQRQAGPLVPARRKLGNRKYRGIEPAPGRYAMQRAD
jgi:polyhydroxyalkanoate synthase subunit PhaC